MARDQGGRRISTVVFDFGGVLLEWDPRHLYRKIFADPTEMEWFLTEVCHGAWNLEQDRGRPWAEAEAEAIARHPAYEPHIRAYRARWQEMVPGPIGGTVSVLERLAAADVPLYAITNFAADTLRESRERFAFFSHFRGVIVSGEVGLLKPDPAIFQCLADRHRIDFGSAVFIDDVAANVAGARAQGMAAIHFSSPRDLEQQLVALGLPLV